MKNEALDELYEAVVHGDQDQAARAAEEARADGVDPTQVLATITRGADEVERLYECSEYFLPELFAGADAMVAAVDVVLPILERGGIQPKGVIVIGTVEGDVHDIGKRIVAAMLAGAGFRVHDLGRNAPARVFVEKARELDADIVAASACFSTTTAQLRHIEEALRTSGLREKVRFLIGGSAVSRAMVEWANADAYAEDAAEAVPVARRLVA